MRGWTTGPESAEARSNRAAWALLCAVVGLMAVLYLALGLAASRGPLILPLDDAYIHFQYARQMARGQPYVYNPGDDPTSGSTSLLYVPLLALGWRIGFTGLTLAYWAVGLGLLSLLIGAWLIDRMIRAAPSALAPPARRRIALLLALGFAVSGPEVWASVSGMETALFTAAVLLALDAYQRGRPLPALAAGSLAALVRPEGALVALTLLLIFGWLAWRSRALNGGYALPLLAVLAQPALNWALTGSVAASGTQVKSHFYNETIPFGQRITTVLDFWVRMWRELLTGWSPVSGQYVPAVITILALLAVIAAAREGWRRRAIPPALLAGAWMLGLSAADATLDTAFWQFKRYQMPIMALAFPLAGWALLALASRPGRWPRRLGIALGVLIAACTLPGIPDYAARYAQNIAVTRDQQIAMARWIADHLPPDARIAVHDVGAVRYVGDRATYDVVGLTTRGTAPAWRQGPGTFYDTLAHHPQRPDYLAIYPDFHGMPFLIQAGVFGDELARFAVTLPRYTASAATGTQVVTRLDWAALDDRQDTPRQLHPQVNPAEFALLATINVGDLASEAAADYTWWNRATFPGFVSEMRALPYAACRAEPCGAADGVRVLNGGECFTLPPIPSGEDYMIVLRVHAASPAALIMGCGGTLDQQVVPAIPGRWLDLVFWLPAEQVGTTRRFCLESAGGKYYPARYWIYATRYRPHITGQEPLARFTEPGGGAVLDLQRADVTQAADAVRLDLAWASTGDLARDGKLFVHLDAGPDQPPVAQQDQYPGGALPPANWLPGEWADSITLPLAGVAPGSYTLALGLYDPLSGERYAVSSGAEGESSDRLVLGEITVK